MVVRGADGGWKGLPKAVMLAAAGLAAIAAAPACAQLNPYRQAAPQGATDTDDASTTASGVVPGLTGFSGRGLAISASVNSRYETNLSRRQPVDDGFRFQPRITADYGIGSTRLGFFVGGSYGRDIVRGNNFFGGGDRSSANAGVDFQFSRCAGEAGASFNRSLNFFGDVAQFGGFQREATAYGAGARCQLGRALSLNLGYTDTRSQFGRGVSQALNVNSRALSGGLSFNGNALGQVSLSGSLSNIDFPGRLVVTPTGPVEDSLSQRNLRLGYARNFGSRVSVSLGVSWLDSQPGTESSLIIIDGVPQFVDRSGFSGLGYDASTDIRLSSRLGFSFNVNRNVTNNPFVGSFFVISNGYGFSVNTKVGRYDLRAGANIRRNQFQGAFASQFDQAPRRNDTFQSYFARLGGRIGKRINAGIELNHNRRKSNPALFSFTSTGVGLNLGVAFGRGSQ